MVLKLAGKFLVEANVFEIFIIKKLNYSAFVKGSSLEAWTGMAGMELQVRSWWLRHGGRLLSQKAGTTQLPSSHPCSCQEGSKRPSTGLLCFWPVILAVFRHLIEFRVILFLKKGQRCFLVTGLSAEWHWPHSPAQWSVSLFPQALLKFGPCPPSDSLRLSTSPRIPVGGHDRTFQKPGSWCI